MIYFKHDSDARNDVKIKKLVAKFGLEGYAAFFLILEMIAGEVESQKEYQKWGELDEQYDIGFLASEWKIDEERVKAMLKEMCRLGLLEGNEERIVNRKILLRSDTYTLRLIREQRGKTLCEDSAEDMETSCEDSTLREEEIISEDIKKRKHISVPFDEILELYHNYLEELPRVIKVTEQHKARMKDRSKDMPDLEEWKAYFLKVRESDFLCGRTDSGWKADFEWITKPSNYAKILNGRYINKGNSGSAKRVASREPGEGLKALKEEFQKIKEEKERGKRRL